MALIAQHLPPAPLWLDAEFDGEPFRVCVDKNVWTLDFELRFRTIPDEPAEMQAWFDTVFARLVIAWELAATADDAEAHTWLPVTLDSLALFPGAVWGSLFTAVLKAVRLNFQMPAAPSSSGTPTDSPVTTAETPAASASPRPKRKSTNAIKS